MPFVTTDDGAQIFYKDWGTDGPPVLLSHGWPLNADSWEAAGAVPGRARATASSPTTAAGTAAPRQTWHGNEMDTYADDLATLIETLDLTRPHPGRATPPAAARSSATSAGTAPRGSPRLVLVAAVPPFMLQTDDNPGGVPIEVFDGIRAGAAADRSQLYRDLADGPVLRPQPHASDVDAGHPGRVLAARAWQCGHRDAYECIAAFSATDFRADLATFDVPTLVIHGDDDQIVPFEVGGKRSAALIEGAVLKVYDGGSPRPPRHRPGPAHTPTCSSSSTADPPHPDPRRPTMTDTRPHPRHHRPRPRPLDDATQLGGLGRALRGARAYRVLTPAYPGFEIEVEALRENPDVIANLTVPETVDHLAEVIERSTTPPIIMGHSFGGTLTQLLLARGLGAAGVVIDSAPTEGVRVNPLSQAKSLFPALKNPANRHKAVGFTAEEFHYAFTNTLSEEESKASTTATPSRRPATGCGRTG